MTTTDVSLSYADQAGTVHQHRKTIPYPSGIYDLVDLIVDIAAGGLVEVLKEIDVTVTDMTIVYFNSKGSTVKYTQSVPYPDGVYQIQQELYLLSER